MTMKERKEKLLKALQQRMKEWEIESVYREAEEDQLPTDILTILLTEFGNSLEEIMGEFFFMPAIEGIEEDSLRFNCILTLSEELDPEYLPSLYEAATVLNYYTEAGTFAINKAGGMLVYRNSIALPLDTTDEEALELIAANTAFSFNVSEHFSEILLSISTGNMTVEELRELLPN